MPTSVAVLVEICSCDTVLALKDCLNRLKVLRLYFVPSTEVEYLGRVSVDTEITNKIGWAVSVGKICSKGDTIVRWGPRATKPAHITSGLPSVDKVREDRNEDLGLEGRQQR